MKQVINQFERELVAIQLAAAAHARRALDESIAAVEHLLLAESPDELETLRMETIAVLADGDDGAEVAALAQRLLDAMQIEVDDPL